MIAPSLCIPRLLDDSITRSYIFQVFDKYNWGPISRIDIVKKNRKLRAFIHYKYWNTTEQTIMIKNKLLNGESINIIYAKPWFWKCSASKIPKP